MAYKEYLIFANQLADAARKIAITGFRNDKMQIKSKGEIASNTVTDVDLKIETLIRKMIKAKYKDHSIVGEEFKNINTKSNYTWVIDPIDGTSALAVGKPTFCVLIALLEKNKPIIGIVDQPILKERWVGMVGSKTTFNNKIIKTSKKTNNLSIAATTPYMFNPQEFVKFNQVVKTLATVKNWGGDAYNFGLLASGLVDIVVESDLKIYDVAALVPIINGAGGFITTWNGNNIALNSFDGTILATGNKIVYDKVLKILNKK